VDALFEHTSSPRQVAAKVKENRGHLAGAYLRLLRFLVENKTGLSYSWAEPSFARSSSRAITQGEAVPLVETLDGVSNLGAEPVNLKGRLEKADLVGGTWRISTDEGPYAGKIKEGGPSLVGIKLGGEYHFSCMEEIEEVGGTGREQRTLYLIEHEPI